MHPCLHSFCNWPALCQLVLHSSTEQEAEHFALNPAAGHLTIRHLYEDCIFTVVNAVAQDCCQPVLHSSTEQYAKHFALNLLPGICVW